VQFKGRNGKKMSKNGIYAHFLAGRAVKMSRHSIIWKKSSEICKKLERLCSLKAETARK
jgi:hypothetical protein